MTKKKQSEGDYEVGYARPPVNTRFKPGQSGNPKGRPKGTKNLKTDLMEEANETILVREDGRKVRISRQRAVIKTLFMKALKGDVRSMAKILELIMTVNGLAPEDEAEEPLSADEEEVLRTLQSYFTLEASGTPVDDDGETS